MKITRAVKAVLGKYSQFSGRAGRSEFWYWILAVFLLSLVLALVEGAIVAPVLGFELFAPEAGQPLRLLMSLLILLPALAVAVRRLHDTGRSGWWWFLQLIPILGSLILLWWYSRAGDEDTNVYGPLPPAI